MKRNMAGGVHVTPSAIEVAYYWVGITEDVKKWVTTHTIFTHTIFSQLCVSIFYIYFKMFLSYQYHKYLIKVLL